MKTKKATMGLTIGSLLLVIIIITLFATSAQKENEPKDPDNSPQSSITQSEKTVYGSTESEEEVAAFVKNVSADSMTVDIIEYITDTDTERIKELKLTEEDMPDGYYFFNLDEEVTTWKCNAETVYTFIDWNGDFTDGEFPVEYTTMDIEEFQKYTETYDNGKPGMPFFFTIENGYIKQMIEKPFA